MGNRLISCMLCVHAAVVASACTCSEQPPAPSTSGAVANPSLRKEAENGIVETVDGSAASHSMKDVGLPKASLTLDRWESVLEVGYQHYASVKAEKVDITPCKRMDGLMNGKTLVVDLRPKDERVFSEAQILISILHDDADVVGAFLTPEPAPDFCVRKESHFLLRSDNWLLELVIPCRAGQLLDYEIGDFLSIARGTLGPARMPGEALLSPCGLMKMQRVSLDSLEKRATVVRNLWGKPFPERRREMRQTKQ